jgi:hypothetical protein
MLVWNRSKRGSFEVKSYYEGLNGKDGPSFPWKALARVDFFVWTPALGKILTHDKLRKMNVVVTEWCCMCNKSGESIEHLLLHCEVSCDLWSYIFTLFGVKWIMPRMVLELTSWGVSYGYGLAKKVCQLVSLCLMWCIWREQNVLHFENVETSMV